MILGHPAVSQRTQAVDLSHLPSWSACLGCSGKHSSSYRPDILQEMASKPRHQERQSVENAGEMSRKWVRRQKGRPRDRRKAKGGLEARREIEINTYNRSVVLKCGPWTSSITWELVRKANRLTHPRLLNQKRRNGALLTSPPGDSGAC